jgi:hypothetical protein
MGEGVPRREMTQLITDKESREYHLKKLYELSLKSIGEISQLAEPTDEQKESVIHKMKAPWRAWEVWNK